MEEEAIEVTGLKLRFRSQLAPKQGKDGNFPYFVEGVMDPQQVESVEWLERLGLKLSARKMMARFKLMGLSTNPATWKGELLVLGEGISVGAPQRGQHVVFDVMHFPAALRGGRLYWNGFKMVGEDLSLLGNGRISMSGGIVAVTRLVASPEIAVEMTKGLHNAGIAEDRWWYDFGTPDRQARDLTVSGRLNDPVVDAGPAHASIPLARLLGPIVESARKKTAVQRTEERTEDARAETLPDHGTTDPENDEDH
jgi:hypothetical protein